MKIGELALQSGLTASRIRFYEASGLIEPAERRLNGYRDYPPQTLITLQIIARGQRAGFSLDEIRSLLPKRDQATRDHEALLRALKAKVAEIEAMQVHLRTVRQDLLTLIAGIEASPDGLACDANADRLMGMLRKPEPIPADI
ncbi:MerR family transcriptional regulator [Caulobacter mirabilis]|uniref:MerR family transcriptional regulator n=1 Tax=Caulobacter mirabilis TaxID=69666 RepID=A0A2D2AX14_9CAUL|nr:MerR family transcriptional regulator [Caulobacter mirabilis]ATQ42487.1 MerR family transcriptional regulator [Caulobacter mirabilis]